MDSRERTMLAVNREAPDRAPTDLWMSKGFCAKLRAERGVTPEEYRDRHDVDLRYIDGPAYVGPPLRTFGDGTTEDIWGVRRRTVPVVMAGGVEAYAEVAASPLAGAAMVEEIEAYDHWPSPDWFDYSVVEAQCDAIRERGRAVVFQGDRMNRIAQLKPAMYLRGIEQVFMDMTLARELPDAVFARIRAFYVEYARRIFESARSKLDLVLQGDDFGQQRGPLVSPAMWERFLGDGFAEYVALAHDAGLKVMHHTCGSVRPIIPLMVARGLDVLQSLQPEAADMDPRTLKAEFGGRLAFHGGISIQNTMPFGTPDCIRAEVRDRVAALAAGGGYILCTSHNLQADVPLANADALLAAYSEYGRT